MSIDVGVTDRIAACRGLDTREIAEAFRDTKQDDVTRRIVETLAERTVASRLPALPYVARHTLYGDEDVSDWLISYTDDGFTIAAADAGSPASNSHIRWEHWEDVVRVLNGDVAAVSLLYGRRVQVEGEDAGTGEPEWFRAVNFASSTLEEYGKILAGLMMARLQGKKELAEYVRAHGIETITAARALVVGSTLVDAGSAAELEGSFMRLVVPGDIPVVAQVDFASTTARPSLRVLLPEGDDGDVTGGCTLRYSSPDAIVAVSSGETSFDQLLISGQVKMEGNDERLTRFGSAVTKLAELYGGR